MGRAEALFLSKLFAISLQARDSRATPGTGTSNVRTDNGTWLPLAFPAEDENKNCFVEALP